MKLLIIIYTPELIKLDFGCASCLDGFFIAIFFSVWELCMSSFIYNVLAQTTDICTVKEST